MSHSRSSYTKNEQILDPNSDWNRADNDEPIFVVRANNWRAVVFLAALIKGDDATWLCLNNAEAMKRWHLDGDDDIPF
jgi:hypothetical protein